MPAPDRPERIGILGGTFDPPHAGHVAAGRAAVETLGLDRLLLVVANDPWQKSGRRTVSPAEDRFALTEALASDIPRAEASRLEIDRGGPSYSVETAEAVLAANRAAGDLAPDLYLVVGADLVPELESWMRPDDLERLVTLAVVSRPNSPAPVVPAGWRVVRVDGPAVDVSSSEVRERLAAGGSVEGLVPAGVIRCIRRRDMYAVPR
ncbi:MAG TPA: nicotinate (nicotinamide) nucleotide adenylyltransferase [Acidimicrobiales bacterium]